MSEILIVGTYEILWSVVAIVFGAFVLRFPRKLIALSHSWGKMHTHSGIASLEHVLEKTHSRAMRLVIQGVALGFIVLGFSILTMKIAL